MKYIFTMLWWQEWIKTNALRMTLYNKSYKFDRMQRNWRYFDQFSHVNNFRKLENSTSGLNNFSIHYLVWCKKRFVVPLWFDVTSVKQFALFNEWSLGKRNKQQLADPLLTVIKLPNQISWWKRFDGDRRPFLVHMYQISLISNKKWTNMNGSDIDWFELKLSRRFGD